MMKSREYLAPAFLIILTFIYVLIIQKTDNTSNLYNKQHSIHPESFDYFSYKNYIENYPFSQLNSSHYYREYIKYKNQSSLFLNSRSNPTWESIGPSNIAGRTLCLAINPSDTSELWMGSAGSGLWKSHSGGMGSNAWKYIPTGFPVISVSSIAIQHNKPEVLYIGTGEVYNADKTDGGIHTRTMRGSRGIGILKTTDSGQSWSLVLDWTHKPNSSIFKIIIDPLNPSILFAATTQGVYKSNDSGITWFESLSLPMASDLIIDHQEPSILYAGIGGLNGTHYGIYKTTDGGDSWMYIKPSNDTIYQGRIMLANYKANPKRVYSVHSDKFKTIAMFRSHNRFETNQFYVRIKDVASYQGWYAKCLHVKDDDSSKIIVGGVDLYLDTSGTGNQLFNLQSWRINIHADLHDIISNPKDPNIIYIATDGGMYRSNNFARTFYSCNGGYISSQFYTGNTSHYSDKIIGGLQDNKSALYTGDVNWNNIHLGDGCYNAFHPGSDSILYIASQYQNLYISLNSGSSWRELMKPNHKSAFVSPFLLHKNNPARIYSGGHQLFISNDGGNSWSTNNQLADGEFIVAIDTDDSNENEIYISTLNPVFSESRLYYSSNGGNTLISMDDNIPNRFIRDIAINPENKKTLLIALGGTGTPGVMISYDKAKTWTFPENKDLPDVPFHSLFIDPRDSNIVYAASDFGLFVSKNQGHAWESYNFHPYDVIPVYDIKYSNYHNKLILFTHGYGAFYCTLVDKSIPTNSASVSTGNTTTTLRTIFLENLLLQNIQLVNLEGRAVTINRDHLNSGKNQIKPGVYFITTKLHNYYGKRIFIYN